MKNIIKRINSYRNKIINILVMIISLGVIIYLFEIGKGKYGVWTFLALTIVIALLRIYQGREQFNFITKLGAEQLRTMKQLNEVKENAKKQRKRKKNTRSPGKKQKLVAKNKSNKPRNRRSNK